MEKEIIEKFIISKEDFKTYFSNRKMISSDELINYYKIKGIIK